MYQRCLFDGYPDQSDLLDIDDFKLYNELYGATEGDNLITLCAQAILSKISPSDLAFRYGTDVFMILTQG